MANTPRAFTTATAYFSLLSLSPLTLVVIRRGLAHFALASSRLSAFEFSDEPSALVHSTSSVWHRANRYCLCIEPIVAN
jgi:uncharacterized BrkB/YihY/UPF0761 family membrane protein